MGTWGHGNLDSDYARDELASRSAALIHSLLLRAARPSSRESDEYDYTTLFVEFELLFALDAAGLLSGHSLPRSELVERLAADYLAGWDAYIDELEPTAEHELKRREVIDATFARFAQLCSKHDDESKPHALPAPPAEAAEPEAAPPEARASKPNTSRPKASRPAPTASRPAPTASSPKASKPKASRPKASKPKASRPKPRAPSRKPKPGATRARAR